MMTHWSIWTVGFNDELSPTNGVASPIETRRLADLVAAIDLLAEGAEPPQLVVLNQRRPGEFSATAIDAPAQPGAVGPRLARG